MSTMTERLKQNILKKAGSAYTEEDKQVYTETIQLMKDCVYLLETYIIQGDEDVDFSLYQINDKQRQYRKQDLETLKQVKEQIANLFENN